MSYDNETDQSTLENEAYFQREYDKLGEHPFAKIIIHLAFASA